MELRNDPSLSITLAQHLRTALRPYRYTIPVFASLLVSLVITLMALAHLSRSDTRLLKSIEPDVSELVGKSDFTDLKVLLQTLTDEHQSHFLIVRGDQVLVSSQRGPRTFESLDLRTYPLGFNISLSKHGLLSEIALNPIDPTQTQKTKLVMLSSLKSILLPIFSLAAFVLIIGILIGRTIGFLMSRTVTRALKPFTQLDQAIRELPSLSDPEQLYRSGILELDSIRSAILDTHRDLINIRDVQAEAKARELTAEVYRLVIHDLEKPIESLRNQVQLLCEGNLDEKTRQEVLALVPKTAEQVLLQVSSARTNLDHEVTHLREADLRPLLEEAIRETRLSSNGFSKIELVWNPPELPILIPHDPRNLRRAITNLVHNAFTACKGQVSVQVEIMNTTHSHSGYTHQSTGNSKTSPPLSISNRITVLIRIIDDGPGMDPADVGLYLQGRKKSTKADRGAYGLAATNHIVRSHGGRLIYRRSPLGGACFEVQL